MSTNAVTEFFQRLESDADLQAKFVSHRKMTLPEIVEFAQAHGYSFTQDEMKEVADRTVGDHELSDTELGLVAGGTGSFQYSSLSLLQNISAVANLKGGISPVAW